MFNIKCVAFLLAFVFTLSIPAGYATEAEELDGAMPASIQADPADSTQELSAQTNAVERAQAPSAAQTHPSAMPDDKLDGVAPLVGLTPHLDLHVPPATPAPQVLQGHVTRPAIAPAQAEGRITAEDNLFNVVSQIKLHSPPKPLGKGQAVKKVVNSGKSLANFVLDLRGFDFSKEGANAILDEKVSPKNEMAKQYLERSALDQQELNLCNGILKLADAMQLKSPAALSKRNSALDAIQLELGENETSRLVSKLCKLQGPGSAPAKWNAGWDVSDRETKAKDIFEAAASNDPVLKDLKLKLHKYNNRSKFAQISAKVVYSTMGVAAFTPTLAAPIAEMTLLSFMMATGGPEQDKLLREIYLSKCLESRYHLLMEKTNLITECYNRAQATHNPALLVCTRDLLAHMAGDTNARTVLDDSVNSLCHQSATTPKIAMPMAVTQ